MCLTPSSIISHWLTCYKRLVKDDWGHGKSYEWPANPSWIGHEVVQQIDYNSSARAGQYCLHSTWWALHLTNGLCLCSNTLLSSNDCPVNRLRVWQGHCLWFCGSLEFCSTPCTPVRIDSHHAVCVKMLLCLKGQKMQSNFYMVERYS